MTKFTGQCLCGAVKITATPTSGQMTACHCDICRRQNSGINFAFDADPETLQVDGEVATFASSSWAERGFCPACGSSLFYRVTGDGEYAGVTKVSAGLFDNAVGLTLGIEFFIDKKPEGYALSGTHERLTEAEVMKLFGAAVDGETT